jgi:hypothetical protein
MYDPQVDKCIKMFEGMCAKHERQMWEATLDWGVVEVSYPGYKKKLEQLVPYMKIRFK